jgi:hypothetical protein
LPRENAFRQLLKQSRRQHAVLIATHFSRNRPKVIAWPREAVQFVQTKVPAVVQSEGPTDGRRNLNAIPPVARRLMCDRRHNGRDIPALTATRSQNDRARPILAALRGSLHFFRAPQEAVPNHQAGPRRKLGESIEVGVVGLHHEPVIELAHLIREKPA